MNHFCRLAKLHAFVLAKLHLLKKKLTSQALSRNWLRHKIQDKDLPIIVLFRDGQIVRDENNNVLGLAHKATVEELRDFIDDYFSDLIEGIIKYSKETPSQFSSIPSEEVLFSDDSPNFEPAVTYQPIVYTAYTAYNPPIWWSGFYQSSFFHGYWAGYRPIYGPGNWPRWYRSERPERWDQWRFRDNQPGRPEGERPGRPETKPEPGKPESGRPEKPNRPNKPETKPGVEKPEAQDLKGQTDLTNQKPSQGSKGLGARPKAKQT